MAGRRIPEREDVYRSWLEVHRLEDELERAKRRHQRLFEARYVHGGKPASELSVYPDIRN